MNRFHRFALRLAALSATALLPVAAQAAVPSTAALEGALMSSGGGPSADGTYNVAFSLYKDASTNTPGWTETAQVTVKGGLFSYTLGSGKAIDAATLAGLGATPFLGIKVETDPELPRRPVGSTLFAIRAGTAEAVDCSGCIGTAQLDPNVLAPYAKTSSLSKAATSGAYADLTGIPDLTVYAKLATLAKVATSGNYADLAGVPDLTAYAKIASLSKVAASGAYGDLSGTPTLANVATTGKYADLSGAPQAVDVGKDCGTGLVIKGIKADGTYNCVNPMDVSALPPDGLNEISNNLLFNQFVDLTAGTPNLAIKDNNPTGVSDSLTFPDIGTAQALTVNVDLTNTDLSTVSLQVYDPNNVVYNLCGNPPGVTGLAPCGKKGDALKTSFPVPTTPAKGDLTSWVGKNPKGKWTLLVIDLGFCTAGAPGCNPNVTDGQVNAWSVQIQTLSSKKVQVKGALIVDGTETIGGNTTIAGSVQVGKDTSTCDASKIGALRFDATYGLQVCQSIIDTGNATTYGWAVAKPKEIIWSGGCTSHGTGGGWQQYCLNGVDFNTAGDYFDVNANGTVTFKVSGYYRINIWHLTLESGYNHIQLQKNGGCFYYDHLYNGASGWKTNYANQVWPFVKGDTLTVQIYANDQYNWHSWNSAGQHSRFQLEYVGQAAP